VTRRAWVALAILAACEHGAPFTPESYAPGEQPRDASGRLTYNVGADRTPVWLPDGSGLLYAGERLDRRDRDRCLSALPPNGGSIRWTACAAELGDSTDIFDSPAVSTDLRLAYVWESSPLSPPTLTPGAQALVLATVHRPLDARPLVTLPYFFSPAGQPHEGITQIRWAGDSALVYLGERVVYARPCGSCSLDTLRRGADLVLLTWQGTTITRTAISGGDAASSVALGSNGDTIYYTRNGESTVFRYVRSSGATGTLYDFAAITRDVTVAAGRLVAVVGGRVTYDVDPVLGPLQRDAGGELHLLDLATGIAAPLPAGGRWYRRPALSPDGAGLVAEGYGYAVVAGDTIVGRVPDLWLVALP
jgi:hypothetical protein